jgi:hypothetical protein
VEGVAVVEGAVGALAGDAEALRLGWGFGTEALDQLGVGGAAGAAVQPLLEVDLEGDDTVEVWLEAGALTEGGDAGRRQ